MVTCTDLHITGLHLMFVEREVEYKIEDILIRNNVRTILKHVYFNLWGNFVEWS